MQKETMAEFNIEDRVRQEEYYLKITSTGLVNVGQGGLQALSTSADDESAQCRFLGNNEGKIYCN